MFDGISIFKHMHVFEQCLVIVFLTHKINPKVFCPNFGVHFKIPLFFFVWFIAYIPMVSHVRDTVQVLSQAGILHV